MNARYKLLAICIVILLSLSVGGTFAQAQDSATPSSSEVTQTLKDRVQKVLKNEEGKVEGATTSQKATFGLVGTLQKVVGSTLQILTFTGTTRVAELDKVATITRLGKPIKNDEIELNSPVVATGIFDVDGGYHVRKLSIVSDSFTQTRRTIVLGSIEALTAKQLTLSVIAGSNLPQLVLPYTQKTGFYDLLDTKIDKKYLKPNMQVVAVIAGDYTATASAARVYTLSAIASASGSMIR